MKRYNIMQSMLPLRLGQRSRSNFGRCVFPYPPPNEQHETNQNQQSKHNKYVYNICIYTYIYIYTYMCIYIYIYIYIYNFSEPKLSMDFRGFASRRTLILRLRGWNSQAHRTIRLLRCRLLK